jgi:hypothetical protein
MTNDSPPLRFRGTPIGLSAVLRDVTARSAVGVVWPAEAGGAAPGGVVAAGVHVAFAPVTDDTGVMRIHLPRTTPPGSYEARVIIDEQERDAVIEVEPDVHLRIFPERLLLAGSMDEVLTREVTIANLGNVEIEIPAVTGFGLFETDGLERAIGAAFNDVPKGERPLDEIFARARDTYGGIARLKIDGGGSLVPGQTRELQISIHLPRNIQPRRTYTGLWSIYQSKYFIQVDGTQKSGAAS